MKRYCFIIAFIVLGLCACNKVEPLVETPETPFTYHLSLQASFDAQTKGVTFGPEVDDISSQFEATDKIYVYNETKKALARHWDEEERDYLATALQPGNITSSGRGCTLEGDLSFWRLNTSDEWESVTIDDNDTYSLFYQMNRPNYPDEDGGPVYVYTFQKGSAESVSQFDFGEANGVEMTKKGSTLTVPGDVAFTNLQSMFRQHLTFKKGSEEVNPATITSLSVNTSKETLVLYAFPTEEPAWRFFTQDSFTISNPEIIDGDVFLALTFDYDQYDPDGDQLILTAYDDDGNVYRCAKDVPDGGFENGTYYYGDMTMLWQYQDVKPTVTRTDGGATITPENGKYSFNLSADPDPVEFTISGSCSGYWFYLTDNAIITLAGDGTAVYSGVDPFIYSEYGFLTISLDSNYTIDCRDHDSTIWADYGDLKLKTTGDSYTLTVIANDPDYRGLLGWYNYDDSTCNPADLAKTGFTVTLTSATDGPDEDNDGNPDYYTWVYTVAPDHIGKVMGADGVVYADVDAATAAGTTAEAMIAYVGRIDGVCEHGLAISLTDIESYQMDYAAATGAYAIPVWAAAHPVTGGTWRLPTAADWQYMLWGYYATDPVAQDITAFNTLLGGVGTALPSNSYFWSGTEKDTVQAIAVYHDSAGVNAGFDNMDKTENAHVRACLSY